MVLLLNQSIRQSECSRRLSSLDHVTVVFALLELSLLFRCAPRHAHFQTIRSLNHSNTWWQGRRIVPNWTRANCLQNREASLRCKFFHALDSECILLLHWRRLHTLVYGRARRPAQTPQHFELALFLAWPHDACLRLNHVRLQVRGSLHDLIFGKPPPDRLPRDVTARLIGYRVVLWIHFRLPVANWSFGSCPSRCDWHPYHAS